MSKSIYDEVLDVLVDSFTDPQDEDNDCFMFNFRQMNKISKAIRKAQKQEKLLELYKEHFDLIHTPISEYDYSRVISLALKIKELENE